MLERFRNNIDEEDEFNHNMSNTLIENIEYLVRVRQDSLSKAKIDKTSQTVGRKLPKDIYIDRDFIKQWLESNPIQLDES